MSKKLSHEDIYSELRRLFPNEYLPLKKIPHVPPHPGSSPKSRPSNEEYTLNRQLVLQPDSTMQDIYEWMRDNDLPSNGYVIRFDKKIIGTEEYTYTDYIWNSQDEYSEEVEVAKKRPVYSEDEVSLVTIQVSYKNPKWEYLIAEAERAQSDWKNKIEVHKSRKALANKVKSENYSTMESARVYNPERWRNVARHLKGKGSLDFLEIEREKLKERLSHIEAQIATGNQND